MAGIAGHLRLEGNQAALAVGEYAGPLTCVLVGL